MKKKVLFMIDSLTCGGAERSLVSLLPLLDYDEVDVTLMLVGIGGVFEQYVPKQVKMITMTHPIGLSNHLSRLLYSFFLRVFPLLGIKEHTAETRWRAVGWAMPRVEEVYDVAIAYQQGFPSYYIADKVIAKHKYTWVNADIKKAGYDVSYTNKVYAKYDKVIGVSDAVCNDLKMYGYVCDTEKIVAVYDILNTDLIRQMSKESGFTDGYTGIRLVTVGRMVPPKSYDLAVKAADELQKRGYKFKWSFVGDGCSRPMIERMIAEYNLGEYIELLGEHANPYPFMAVCDIYVQTSSFEGFGLTVTEARILGKAEVCTNFPSAYNQITDGETGLICEMTPKAVADKIELLLLDNKLKTKLEENVAKEVNTTAETESAKVKALIEI